MRALTGWSLLLVILLVSLSAYLRLSHSGIGCDDWPGCYGRIGLPPASSEQTLKNAAEATGDAYRNLLENRSMPLSWATPLHRGVASVLGLLIVALNVVALRSRRHRFVCFLLLTLTVYLAIIGIRSNSLHDPSVVMSNIGGGFAMLGLLGWLYFRLLPRRAKTRASRPFVMLACAALCLQILLGGLTSANFAATACRTLPDCHGSYWPGEDLGKALDLSRHHEVTDEGVAIGGEERIDIHKAHRIGAAITFLLALWAAMQAIRGPSPGRQVGWFVALIASVQFSAGVASVMTGLPIVLAVAHNWLAGLLLLGLLRLLSLTESYHQSPGR